MSRFRWFSFFAPLLVGALLFARPAQAEWGVQTLQLNPGWNAVFVEVQPEDNRCEAIFAGLPVKTVWYWNRKTPMKQFIQDPSELLPKPADWLLYYPKGEARAFLTDLFRITSGEPYLIEVGGSEPVTLTLEGVVSAAQPRWVPDSFNFTGFHVNPNKGVKFKDFVKYDDALAGQEVYRVQPDGKSVKVNPETESVAAGVAYWMYCKGPSTYAGPFAVEPPVLTGLDFGKDATERPLVFKNNTSAPRELTLRVVPSLRAGTKSRDKETGLTVAGDVALSYKRLLAWQPLEGELKFTVQPNSSEQLELAMRRAALESGVLDGESQFESVIEVSDSEGGFFRLPVKGVVEESRAGLWVGNVSLTKVSETERPNDLTTTAAPSPFEFRIIVHVDEDGDATLLQKVYLMQVQEVLDNQDPPNVIDPARYVLLTRDDLVPQYTGVSLRDGQVVGRRITSPVFSFRNPVSLVGGVTPGTSLTGTIQVNYDDALNPFVHKFHPDHDNLNERFEATPLGEGVESFTFVREITLSFTEQDPEALGLPEWGYNLIGGTYREDVTGVHKRKIRTEGTFTLTRVSDVAVLNDGN